MIGDSVLVGEFAGIISFRAYFSYHRVQGAGPLATTASTRSYATNRDTYLRLLPTNAQIQFSGEYFLSSVFVLQNSLFPGLRGGTEASLSGVDGRLGPRNHKR